MRAKGAEEKLAASSLGRQKVPAREQGQGIRRTR